MNAPELRWAARSDVGRARDRNEDAYFGGERVFAVADGLGGHNAGDVASRLAIEPIGALDRRLADVSDDRVGDVLTDAVLEANRAVHQQAQANAKVRGMGTTLTVVAIADSSAYLAHVGDSRCYLIRDGEMSQLSSDHTLVARMVQEGKLTPEQAEVHPQRSILTRALGAEPEVDVDSLRIELVPGDRLVLCSDGLSSVIGDDRIRAVLTETADLDQGCSRLIEEANAQGGPDNITVVVVELTGVPRPRAERPAERPAAQPATAAVPAKRAHRPRRIPVRAIIWVLAIAVVVLGGWVGFRSWVNRSYFVGVDHGKVAIFRGLPTEIAGVELNHVEEPTAIRFEDVPEVFRRSLREGIRTDGLADARAVVTRILQRGSPTPTPTPTST